MGRARGETQEGIPTALGAQGQQGATHLTRAAAAEQGRHPEATPHRCGTFPAKARLGRTHTVQVGTRQPLLEVKAQ